MFESQEQHPGSGVVVVVVDASSDIHVPWHGPSHLTCEAVHQVDVPQPALFQEQHPADGGLDVCVMMVVVVVVCVMMMVVVVVVGAGDGDGIGAGVDEGVGVCVGAPLPIQPVEPTPQAE